MRFDRMVRPLTGVQRCVVYSVQLQFVSVLRVAVPQWDFVSFFGPHLQPQIRDEFVDMEKYMCHL